MYILKNVFVWSLLVSFVLLFVDCVEGRGFRGYRGYGGSGSSSMGGMIAGFVLLGLMFLIVIAVLVYRWYALKKQGRTFCQSNTSRTQPTTSSSTVANVNTTSSPKSAPPPYRSDYLSQYSTYPPPPPAYTWPQQSQDPVYPPPPPTSNY